VIARLQCESLDVTGLNPRIGEDQGPNKREARRACLALQPSLSALGSANELEIDPADPAGAAARVWLHWGYEGRQLYNALTTAMGAVATEFDRAQPGYADDDGIPF
jgi:hypothetical protein